MLCCRKSVSFCLYSAKARQQYISFKFLSATQRIVNKNTEYECHSPSLWILQKMGALTRIPAIQQRQIHWFCTQYFMGNCAIFALMVYGYFMGRAGASDILAAEAKQWTILCNELPKLRVGCFGQGRVVVGGKWLGSAEGAV